MKKEIKYKKFLINSIILGSSILTLTKEYKFLFIFYLPYCLLNMIILFILIEILGEKK